MADIESSKDCWLGKCSSCDGTASVRGGDDIGKGRVLVVPVVGKELGALRRRSVPDPRVTSHCYAVRMVIDALQLLKCV